MGWLKYCSDAHKIAKKIESKHNPDSKVHGANMGPTWVLSAPDGPHVGPMNLAIREFFVTLTKLVTMES